MKPDLPIDRVVRPLRCGRQAEAAEALAELTTRITTALEEGTMVPTPHLGLILDEILAAQTRGDWLWLADLLEYELRREVKGEG